MMDKPKRAPVLMQASIVIMCFLIVAMWLSIGFLSGLKPPFKFFVWTFEGGYQAEPGFMSTLTTIVTAILSAALGALGYNRVIGNQQQQTPEPPPAPPALPQAAVCPICNAPSQKLEDSPVKQN